MFLFFLLCLDKNAGNDVQTMVEKEILADSDISMTTAGSHSSLSRQCHDLYYPRGQAPVVGRTVYHLTVTGGVLWKNWK